MIQVKKILYFLSKKVSVRSPLKANDQIHYRGHFEKVNGANEKKVLQVAL